VYAYTVYSAPVTHASTYSDEPASWIHVGRQPIYDRSGDVVAYELLFRDSAAAQSASRSTAQATSQVIVAAFTEFGLAELVGSRACFVNVTREFLTGELPVPFDSDQAVLEIVETVEVDDMVIDGTRALVERGFTIALDDFVWGAGAERLLDWATYVKVDMLDADPAGVAETIEQCRRYPHIQLVAERLETEEQLQHAMRLGFDFFQGHVLGRPHVLSTASMSPTRAARLQLIATLNADEVDFDEVVSLISRDPAITYRLLRATNSAASGLAARVSSVGQAALLLGLATIRQWVTLMLFSDLTDATEDQVMTTLVRARLCQLLAEKLRLSGGAAFTVGLLSGVADLLAERPADLITELPLADDVVEALTAESGDLGRVLHAVRAYEQGQPAAIAVIDAQEMIDIYLSAVSWSTHTVSGALADQPLRRADLSR
jgi:c-di-GMP-related signal transduction protein